MLPSPFEVITLFLTVLSSCGSDDGGGGGVVDNRPRLSVVYMWYTSGFSYDGDLGGISGADAECVADTTGRGTSISTAVTTHRVVLASSTNDPRNYFANDPPLERRDGTTIASTYSAFFVRNQAVTASVWTNSTSYWTGLDGVGAPDTDNCSDWTDDTTGSASAGSANQTSNNRYNSGATSCSAASRRLLCISY